MLVLADLRSQLDALKKTFDDLMITGTFQEAKAVYVQIKALEEAIRDRKSFLNLTDPAY